MALRAWRDRWGALLVASAAALSMNLVFSVPGPFLAAYAEDTWGGSKIQVALLWTLSTGATMVACPPSVYIAHRLGRNRTCYIGLIGLAASLFAFGFAWDMTSALVLRFVQGVFGAMLAVSTLAIMTLHAGDLAREIAIKEFASGLGLVIGPVFGGALYELLGFTATFVATSVFPFACLVLGLVFFPKEDWSVLEAAHGAGKRSSAHGAPPGVLNRTVVIATTCVALAYLCLAFLGPVYAKHLEHSLGIGSAGSGGVLALGALANVAIGCPAATYASRDGRLGPKNTLALGLVALGTGFLLLPGAPLLASVIAPGSYPRWLSWLCTVVGMLAIGVGVGFEMVPTLPAMRASVGKDAALVDDQLSSLFFFALTGGATVGPLLSTLLYSTMPATPAPSCTGSDCDTAFSGASIVVGGMLFAIAAIAFVFLPASMSLESPHEYVHDGDDNLEGAGGASLLTDSGSSTPSADGGGGGGGGGDSGSLSTPLLSE